MISISVKSDISQALRQLRNDQRQMAFAAALALTKTAQHVKSAETKEMQRVFDRPTPYTLNSLYVKPATKSRLEAIVWLKDDTFKGTPAARYLMPQISGGQRKQKRFERALINAGLMPAGYYAVPAAGAPIDAFGNIQSRFIVQLLSYMRAFGEQGYNANMTDAGKKRYSKAAAKRTGSGGVEYFAINRKSHLPMGIYMRVRYMYRSAIKPVLLYVKNPGYKSRFDFYKVADETVMKTFDAYLQDAIKLTISTAR